MEVEPLNKRYEKELKILNRIIEATHNKEEELINKVHLFGQDKNQTKLESYGFEFEGEEE